MKKNNVFKVSGLRFKVQFASAMGRLQFVFFLLSLIIFPSLWVGLGVGSLFAQNEVDALRYSLLNQVGTARYTSMAGAFSALGGDFTAASINPAGFGLYKKSEFTFTPGFYSTQTNASFYNHLSSDNNYNFNISNCGLVVAFSDNDDIKKGWTSVNLAIGYNRINDFNNNIIISGDNTESSLLDYFVATANGNRPENLDPFTNLLAYNTYLIDPDTIDSTTYESIIPDNSKINQSKSISTIGRMSETIISIGANYNNKFYIGASVGFPNIKYIEDASYTEKAVDSIPDFNSFNMIQYLKTTGGGFNFKLGFIYKIYNWFRIGGVVQTPSFFDMHDNWNNNITANVHKNTYQDKSPAGEYDYELRTPLRATGGIAFVFGDKGILSTDYEIIDYSDARLRSAGYPYLNENTAIENKYTVAHNYRIGTEWRLDPFTFRGGIAYFGSPFNEALNNNTEHFSYSVGFGIREEGYFIDFACVLRQYTEKYYLYPSDFVAPAIIETQSNIFLITLGYRF